MFPARDASFSKTARKEDEKEEEDAHADNEDEELLPFTISYQKTKTGERVKKIKIRKV